MRTVILVPRREDGGQRDRVWEFVKAWWSTNTDYPIFEGKHEGDPFSRSLARNNAAALAGDWDVALLLDADNIAESTEQVVAAVQIAADTGHMTWAHHWRFALNESFTASLLRRSSDLPKLPYDPEISRALPDILEADEWSSYGPTFSSLIAIRRDLWDDIGGFDERFQAWGHEDIAFWTACETIAGPNQRIEGAIFHLWHARPPQIESQNPHHDTNQALSRPYWAAYYAKSSARMREIVNLAKEHKLKTGKDS